MNDSFDTTTILTKRLGALREEAIQEAARQKQAYLGAEHVFIALLRRPGGVLERLVRGLGLDPLAVRDAIRRETGTGRHDNLAELQPSPRLVSLLQSMDGATTDETALLRSLLEEGESLPVRYLRAFGHSPEALLAQLEQTTAADAEGTRLSGGGGNADATHLSTSIGVSPAVSAALSSEAGPAITPLKDETPLSLPTPNLDRYGRDLAKAAWENCRT
jgi:ATP-dependent Clp protease ATP-binding subunit ClpA